MTDPGNEQKLIGGLFGLPMQLPENSVAPPFLNENSIGMINARSCIYLLIEQLHPRQVWVPSYLCHTILDAVSLHDVELRFFEIDDALRVASRDWIEEIHENDLAILIDYFGFPLEEDVAASCRKAGARVLEDASQALLKETPSPSADFIIYSPRKFIGVPDGGILNALGDNRLSVPALETAPGKWWLKAVQSCMVRRDFDKDGKDRSWFALYQEANRKNPIGMYGMSDLAWSLLKHGFDYRRIAAARRENYRMLHDRLAHLAIFPTLDPAVVPLGFPICLPERERIRNRLFQDKIFPPVHWEIAEFVPERFADSHRLSREIMTLPCDQRYNAADMERMASLILEELA